MKAIKYHINKIANILKESKTNDNKHVVGLYNTKRFKKSLEYYAEKDLEEIKNKDHG